MLFLPGEALAPLPWQDASEAKKSTYGVNGLRGKR